MYVKTFEYMESKIMDYKKPDAKTDKRIFDNEKAATSTKIKDLEETVRMLKEEVETLSKEREK